METQKGIYKIIAVFFCVFLCIFLLSSCAKPLKLEPPLKVKQLNETQNETVSTEEIKIEAKKDELSEVPAKPEEKVEEITLPTYKRETKEKILPPPPEEKPPLDLKILPGVKGPVVLNVENMPLNDFIIYVLGELLKVGFIMDEDVMKMTNPVTLRLPQALEPEEVLSAVVSYLEKLGLEVSQKGKVLSITKPKPKPSPPTKIEALKIGETASETSARIAQFLPLKYVSANELEFLLREYLLKGLGIEIKSYPKENSLLFIGPGYQIKEIIEIVSLLDVPFFSNKNLYFYKVTYWQAEEFIKELTSLLQSLSYPIAKNIKEPGILFIPIKSLNSVIMAFPDEEAFQFTLSWVKKLDSPEAAGAEVKFYIYKPLYSKAVDLAESLSKFITGQAFRVEQAQPSPPQAPPPGKTPSPQAQTKTQVSFSAQGISASADERRNLLLISATPSQYQQILQVLKELDKPPRQVLIEATILELTLKDELRFGLEWYLRNRVAWGNYTIGQILGVPSSPGFTFTLISDTERFNLLLNLFAAKGLTNILSTPRLMVLDNQAATIQVGTDVPVITGEVTTAEAVTGVTAGVVRSIQYRSTGVILTVKPTIYTEGMLQLEITQEVSEMGTAPPGIESPTILIRKINTNVIAGDGQTIVLGGLISTTKGEEESKVPFLGDIPLLGNLFKSKSIEERKTELIVLLRPYIVKSLEEAKAITEELKERLKWLKE